VQKPMPGNYINCVPLIMSDPKWIDLRLVVKVWQRPSSGEQMFEYTVDERIIPGLPANDSHDSGRMPGQVPAHLLRIESGYNSTHAVQSLINALIRRLGVHMGTDGIQGVSITLNGDEVCIYELGCARIRGMIESAVGLEGWQTVCRVNIDAVRFYVFKATLVPG
jgi:hypothetical protein